MIKFKICKLSMIITNCKIMHIDKTIAGHKETFIVAWETIMQCPNSELYHADAWADCFNQYFWLSNYRYYQSLILSQIHAVKYSNIVTRSISECPITRYPSDIVWAVILGTTETIGEDGTIIRTLGKARPGLSSRYWAGRPEPQFLYRTNIKWSVVTGRSHNTQPCMFSVFWRTWPHWVKRI